MRGGLFWNMSCYVRLNNISFKLFVVKKTRFEMNDPSPGEMKLIHCFPRILRRIFFSFNSRYLVYFSVQLGPFRQAFLFSEKNILFRFLFQGQCCWTQPFFFSPNIFIYARYKSLLNIRAKWKRKSDGDSKVPHIFPNTNIYALLVLRISTCYCFNSDIAVSKNVYIFCKWCQFHSHCGTLESRETICTL